MKHNSRSVDLVHEVFQYLKDGRYPDGSTLSHKRNIRRKANRFVLKEIYCSINKGGRTMQVLVPWCTFVCSCIARYG